MAHPDWVVMHWPAILWVGDAMYITGVLPFGTMPLMHSFDVKCEHQRVLDNLWDWGISPMRST